VVAASGDFGRTFAPYRRVDTTLDAFTGGLTPYSQGSNPQIGRDGTLYVAYEGTFCATLDCTDFGDRDVTVVARSTDRGRTFTRTVVDTNYDFPPNEAVGRATLTGENFRINSYPQLAYDPVTDRLTTSWNDDRNGSYTADGESIRTNGDTIVAGSRGGRSWSVQVFGTPQNEVFSAVATLAGLTAVTAYTRHWDPDGVKLDYAYWKAFGSQRLSSAPVRRITTESADPRIQFVAASLLDPTQEVQGVFIGDYTAVAVGTDLRIHACWTDFRGRPGGDRTEPGRVHAEHLAARLSGSRGAAAAGGLPDPACRLRGPGRRGRSRAWRTPASRSRARCCSAPRARGRRGCCR
jgi:hypothetical protein